MYVVAPSKIDQQSVSVPSEPERHFMTTEPIEGDSMSAMCASFSSFWCCGDTNCQILYLQDKDSFPIRLAGTRQAVILEFQVYTASQALAQ